MSSRLRSGNQLHTIASALQARLDLNVHVVSPYQQATLDDRERGCSFINHPVLARPGAGGLPASQKQGQQTQQQ